MRVLKKVIKIAMVILVLVILLPNVCFGAGSDELYAYLCEGGNDALIYKLNDTAAEAGEIYSQAVSIWCKANNAEVVRENEKITIKYNNEEIDLSTVYNNIETELQKNPNYNEYHSVINSPETNFGAKAIEYIANNPSDWIYNRVGEISGVELTPEEENNQATVTEPNNDMGDAGNIFKKALDGLFGILLYPIRLIILALGGIFNIIIRGIASIGGEGGEGLLISLKDIIFTTTATKGGQGDTNVPIVAIDFFNIDNNVSSEVEQIRQGIANWFYVFRNLSIVISLCVLIYTGIRMAISSIAEDKAKYKTMITNWLVQMVLIFFMQYIIFFTIGLNISLVDALNPSSNAGEQGDISVDYMDSLYETALKSVYLTEGLGAAIVYCVLLGMTFIFLIMYIKRMITIGFLIIISPLVTITYSIDKMGDSKSQALNTWLKEFVYNVLIQPFHCIIYLVFASIAMSLLTVGNAGNFGAPVFAILCIMFMNKAEDILRKIFAFENAKSLGSGLASAAMIGAGLSTVSSMFKKEESTKKTGDANAMPNIDAIHKSQAEQNAKDSQIDGAQQASDKAAEQVAQNNNGIQRTARQIERDRRKNRAIESWQNFGGVRGLMSKGVKMQAKAALPVFAAFLGAGQGNVKSMVGAGTAGYAIEKGIGNAIDKRAKPSQIELSRQAKANEAALSAIYQEQEKEWTKKGGRWAGYTKEEILNDVKYLATINNINEIKEADARHFAHVVQAGVGTYAALGNEMPVGDLVEFIRRQQG